MCCGCCGEREMVRLDRATVVVTGRDRRRDGLFCRVWEDDVRDWEFVLGDGDEVVCCEEHCFRGRLWCLEPEVCVLDS